MCEHYLTLLQRVEVGQAERPANGAGPFARLVMDKGRQHEAACLENYAARGIDVLEVPARLPREPFEDWVARVSGILGDGHAVVFQMPFIHQGMRGIADFLERVDLPDGGFTYEPVDAKLARSDAKPAHILQLSFYADAIESNLGTLPEYVHVWLGSGQRESIRTREVRAYWHRLRTRLTGAMASPGESGSEPVPCQHCDFCEFATQCDDTWREQDALHYVSGIRSTDREALTDAGIASVAQLAAAEVPVPGVDESRYVRLHRQSSLQVLARDQGDDLLPPFEQIPAGGEAPWGYGHELLPEPDDGDVFLDFEGHPFWRADAGLFFLFGFIAKNDAGEWEYQGRWAHDADGERASAAWLVDTLYERLERYPAAHVYHYNHTERSALQALFIRHQLDDARLGVLVRQGAFVDLLEVVRNAVQIGAESYSLKEVERLSGFQRGHDITKGAGAVIEYDGFMARVPDGDRAGLDHADQPELTSIARYNEDDVRATKAVRDWLVDIRPPGTGWRSAKLDDATIDEGVDALADALRGSDLPSDHLLADMLGYWAREGRAHAAQLRARAESPDSDLIADEDAVGGLHSPLVVKRLTPKGREAKHPGLEVRFPPQVVDRFSDAMYLTDDGEPGYCTVHEIYPVEGRAVLGLRTEERERGDTPRQLVKNDWVNVSGKRSTVTDWAQLVASADSVAVDDARSQLLAGRPPRFLDGGGPPTGRFTDDLDGMSDWVGALDRSYLAIQGPPGTGKTYRAARIIHSLVAGGRRVGITAMSHAAIHNLVKATHAAFEEADDLDRLAAVVKRNEEPEEPLEDVTYTKSNPTCAGDEFNVVAGTTWLFASSPLQAAPVDLLVVDEAGQLALIDVIAATSSADNLLLLGDPQQLPHVALATHPNGSGASVLEHVLGGEKTLQPADGVFLPETRRMHPDISAFISEQFYEGRLRSHKSCALQTTELGTGLRWIRAEHVGCSTRAPDEVDRIVREIERLVGQPWTDHAGEQHVLRAEDVMVVAPYNAQKDAIRTGLTATGLQAVRVGTVDKFQGQEAPVVFFSAATSSADDAPRGLGFVFSRNRFNVAISRARCLAYLVCTETVLDASARTVDEMKTLSSACAFAATAAEVGR